MRTFTRWGFTGHNPADRARADFLMRPWRAAVVVDPVGLVREGRLTAVGRATIRGRAAHIAVVEPDPSLNTRLYIARDDGDLLRILHRRVRAGRMRTIVQDYLVFEVRGQRPPQPRRVPPPGRLVLHQELDPRPQKKKKKKKNPRLPALLEARQPVVRERLPVGRRLDVLVPLRPDAGIAVDRAQRHADDPVAARLAREHVPAAAGEQNDFERPSGGCQELTASAPDTSRNAPASTIPFSDHSAPLRRWQRLQWQ